MLQRPADIAALIKPQFEAGREKVGKSGVIRDSAVHKEVLINVLTMAAELGFGLHGLTFSPITGGEGNIEFLAHWRLTPEVAEGEESSVQPAAAVAAVIPVEDFPSLADKVIKQATGTFNVSSTHGNSARL